MAAEDCGAQSICVCVRACVSVPVRLVLPALVCSIVWWWSGIFPGLPYPWKKKQKQYMNKSWINTKCSFKPQTPTSVSDFLPTRLCKSQKCFQKDLCVFLLSPHMTSAWPMCCLPVPPGHYQFYDQAMTDTTHICHTHSCFKTNILIPHKDSPYSLPCRSLTISVPALWYHLLAAFSFWSQYL